MKPEQSVEPSSQIFKVSTKGQKTECLNKHLETAKKMIKTEDDNDHEATLNDVEQGPFATISLNCIRQKQKSIQQWNSHNTCKAKNENSVGPFSVTSFKKISKSVDFSQTVQGVQYGNERF